VWEFEDRGFVKPKINKYRYKVTPESSGVKRYQAFKNGQFFDDSECVVNGQGELLFVNQ
jgi:hypothetical protein